MYFVNRMNWHEAQQQYRHQQQQKSWVFCLIQKSKMGEINACVSTNATIRDSDLSELQLRKDPSLSLSLYLILNCNANVYINEIRFSFELTIVIGTKWTVTEPYRKAKKKLGHICCFLGAKQNTD